MANRALEALPRKRQQALEELCPERRRVLDYLASFGLDGTEISASGISEAGFTMVRQGADPGWVHPWPEGFDYGWFSSAVAVAHIADLRRAGLRL